MTQIQEINNLDPTYRKEGQFRSVLDLEDLEDYDEAKINDFRYFEKLEGQMKRYSITWGQDEEIRCLAYRKRAIFLSKHNDVNESS